MTLQITPQMIDNSTVSTIENDLNQLDQTQEELSTGYQINEPSDDPYGAAETISLQSQISAYSAYTTNINQGTAWVQTASQSLQSILQVAQTVSEVAEEGANGTSNATDLADSAQEVLQYIGEVKETADTQYDGSYIFSGSDVNTEPYNDSTTGSDTYQGNTDPISYTIGPSTTLQVNSNLSSVLGNGSATGTGSGSDSGLLSTMRNIYNDLETGNTSDLQTQMTNIQTNMSDLESLQATVGATQDRLQLASSRISSLSTTDTTELGNVYDVDEATATTQFTTEQASYQAALQSTADIVQTSLLNFLSD